MNILFVNYGDYSTNSLQHIGPYANQLTRNGHSCIVAVPKIGDSLPFLGDSIYLKQSYNDILYAPYHFPNGKPADIVHAWTPRISVCGFLAHYLTQYSCPLIFHLEDNEEALIESFYNTPISSLRKQAILRLRHHWEEGLSHPIEHKALLSIAQGYTVVIDSLKDFLPNDRPHIELLPGLESYRLRKSERTRTRNKLSIPDDQFLIVYPGGVSASNIDDILNLYRSIKKLREQGIDIFLLKTGPNSNQIAERLDFDISEISKDWGFVPRSSLIRLLNAADILVQPGADDRFNRYRLPSKLPDFLASGVPVITSATNLGKRLRNAQACFTMENSSPDGLAAACKNVLQHRSLAKETGERGKAFAQKAFSLKENTKRLFQFYLSVIASFEKQNEQKTRPSSIKEMIVERIDQLECTNRNPSAPQPADLTEFLPLYETCIGELVKKRFKEDKNAVSILTRIKSRLAGMLQRKPQTCSFNKPANSTLNRKALRTEEAMPKPSVQRYPTVNRRNPINTLRAEEILISILLPVYKANPRHLSKTIGSVFNQIHQNWELCIVEDHSQSIEIRQCLDRFGESDDRIKIHYRDARGHISRASNDALEMATGIFVVFLDHDDVLEPKSLRRIAEAIVQYPDAKIVYSDEDKFSDEGKFHEPHFKTAWNQDLLLNQNYICHLCAMDTSIARSIGGFRPGFEGSQDWDLLLRAIAFCDSRQIIHIPEILYHWRLSEGSTSLNPNTKPYAVTSAERAIHSYLVKHQPMLEVKRGLNGNWRITPTRQSQKLSVLAVSNGVKEINELFAFADALHDLRRSMNVQILGLSHNRLSLEKKDQESLAGQSVEIRHTDSFIQSVNLELENFAYDCIVMTEANLLPKSPTDIIELIGHATRPEIGCVSGKIFDTSNRIISAGVALDTVTVYKRLFRGLSETDDGYFQRAYLNSNYSICDPLCIAFGYSTWRNNEGFDESLGKDGSILDFCLKALSSGCRNLFVPNSQFIFLDRSRTRHEAEFLPDERNRFESRWSEFLLDDPYLNPNLLVSNGRFSTKTGANHGQL